MTANKLVEEKIESLNPFLDDFPGVVIIHEMPSADVKYMSRLGLEKLGITLEELLENYEEYYVRFFNPEDAAVYVPRIVNLVERNEINEVVSYFQQVRLKEYDEWQWYASATRILLRDENNAPILSITTSIPIDATHFISTKLERLLEENTMLKKYTAVFSSLTKREIEICKLIASGKNNKQISSSLFISEDTVKTHRKNLKKKLAIQSNFEILKFAQLFNLI
jgi:DNA-binding CsgD family transcriptional regulator